MVVKSLSPEHHACDLAEVFAELKKHNMKLNPKKCTFRVGGGKFLGFMLTHRGIEEYLDKCKVVITMRSLENVNEVQKLTRRLASFYLNSYPKW